MVSPSSFWIAQFLGLNSRARSFTLVYRSRDSLRFLWDSISLHMSSMYLSLSLRHWRLISLDNLVYWSWAPFLILTAFLCLIVSHVSFLIHGFLGFPVVLRYCCAACIISCFILRQEDSTVSLDLIIVVVSALPTFSLKHSIADSFRIGDFTVVFWAFLRRNLRFIASNWWSLPQSALGYVFTLVIDDFHRLLIRI